MEEGSREPHDTLPGGDPGNPIIPGGWRPLLRCPCQYRGWMYIVHPLPGRAGVGPYRPPPLYNKVVPFLTDRTWLTKVELFGMTRVFEPKTDLVNFL